jgi:hypothetical protein
MIWISCPPLIARNERVHSEYASFGKFSPEAIEEAVNDLVGGKSPTS